MWRWSKSLMSDGEAFKRERIRAKSVAGSRLCQRHGCGGGSWLATEMSTATYYSQLKSALTLLLSFVFFFSLLELVNCLYCSDAVTPTGSTPRIADTGCRGWCSHLSRTSPATFRRETTSYWYLFPGSILPHKSSIITQIHCTLLLRQRL